MTTYIPFRKEIKGNIFEILVVSGKYNYISISKITNNPFRTVGKEFNSYDSAVKGYKSAEMKTFILEVEMNLIMPCREALIA